MEGYQYKETEYTKQKHRALKLININLLKPSD